MTSPAKSPYAGSPKHEFFEGCPYIFRGKLRRIARICANPVSRGLSHILIGGMLETHEAARGSARHGQER